MSGLSKYMFHNIMICARVKLITRAAHSSFCCIRSATASRTYLFVPVRCSVGLNAEHSNLVTVSNCIVLLCTQNVNYKK